MRRKEDKESTCLEFKSALIISSVSKNYEDAKKEWCMVCSYPTKEEEKCICGHLIKNVTIIKNNKNGIELPIGSDCIEYFFHDIFGPKFNEIRKEANDINKLYNFIYKFYNFGISSGYKNITLLNSLNRNEYTALKQFNDSYTNLHGLSVEEIDDWVVGKTYYTTLVKRMCDIYHEAEKQFKFKLELKQNKDLTPTQLEYWVNKRYESIRYFNNTKNIIEFRKKFKNI